MAILGSGVQFLWALLAFASTIHGQAASPDLINDFCALSTHMSGCPVLPPVFFVIVLNTY